MIKTILIIFLILPLFGFAQIKNIGIPSIKNYTKSAYGAATQNWGIAQDKNGFMYFANNDGVLQFDGVHWNLIEVSKNSPARSVFVNDSNKIYVGLSNDFGVITQPESMRPVYKSLKHLLPPNLGDFDDVWRIHEIPDGIVFQCYKYLFLFKSDKIEIIKPESSFHFSFQLDDRLFLHEPDLGVYELINRELVKLPYWEEHKDKDISAILETEKNQILICTASDGIYKFENEKIEKWDTPVNDFIKRNRLYCATTIPGNYFAFGTISNGLIISDSKGNIIQEICRNEGLQNNTVLSVFVGKDRNLWLGLDNGIDYVEINSPISFVSNSEDLGTGYCCMVHNNKLYLGTNQGLFVKPFNINSNYQSFELVENSAGQVWSLEVFDGQLICGHDLGTFSIKGKKATRISDIKGAWKYIKLKNNPAYLLGGHYSGLVLLKKGKSGWEFHKKVKGFSESSRYIKQSEDGNIWISHGGKGVFQISLSEKADSVNDFILYTSEDGLPTSTDNILFEFNNRLYVSTTDQVYEYNKSSDAFQVSQELNQLFIVGERIKSLVSDSLGNIWYIGDIESGVLRQNEDLTYTKIITPFRKLNNEFVDGFEFLYPLKDENSFIGIDNGFAHYSSKFPKSYSQSFKTFITKVEVPFKDSILFLNNFKSDILYEFPFSKNAFRFHFAAPFFENSDKIEFSYFLENFTEEWSDWSYDNYKDFTNLYEGKYVFKVKAKNIYGVVSEVSEFRFTIVPPWHRSKMALYIYLALLGIMLFLLIRYFLHRIELSKKKERIKHDNELRNKEEEFQHQALIADKQIIKLRNDKLRAEKIHSDKELANQTMSLIQKNKFLNKLGEELQRIQNLTSDSGLLTKMVLIRKSIKKELDNEEQNKLFKTYFEDVHAEFFKRLKEKYPHLTPGDLKLCAYIKMDISTKEISTLLNISYRGVEISRYRLRKKLELSRDINLSTFLLNI